MFFRRGRYTAIRLSSGCRLLLVLQKLLSWLLLEQAVPCCRQVATLNPPRVCEQVAERWWAAIHVCFAVQQAGRESFLRRNSHQP